MSNLADLRSLAPRRSWWFPRQLLFREQRLLFLSLCLWAWLVRRRSLFLARLSISLSSSSRLSVSLSARLEGGTLHFFFKKIDFSFSPKREKKSKVPPSSINQDYSEERCPSRRSRWFLRQLLFREQQPPQTCQAEAGLRRPCPKRARQRGE